MPHRLVRIDRDDPEPGPLEEAAWVLRRGGLVAFPTETVYGLGADATSTAAVERIYRAKGRPPSNPLIVHADGVDLVRRCVDDWPEQAERLADAFWPGPLTLVLPRSRIIPDIVTAGRSTVGVRVPEPTVARRLIAAAGVPLAAPSANRSTGISPTTAAHVAGDLGDAVDLVLDGGPTTIGLESTVVDICTGEPRLLRPGPITARELEGVLGGVPVGLVGPDGGDGPQLSPGRMPVHYAPRTRSIRIERTGRLAEIDGLATSALIVVGPHDPPPILAGVRLVHLPEPTLAARRLYATLHECDGLGVSRIVVLMPPDLPEWQAIRDRLRRATVPWGSSSAE